MRLFPAIDIMNGRAVRLHLGKRDRVTDYGDPVERALLFMEQGADYLHVVDLDSAFDGTSQNGKIISRIVRETGLPVQTGGGVRSLDRVTELLEDVGVDRVIVGTIACTNPDVIDTFTSRYANRIACGIDVVDGFVAVKGWTENSKYRAKELALVMKEKGVDTVVYTDVSRDGALTGVNVASTVQLSRETGMNIIASGGVKGVEDVEALLKAGGVYGVILGKALYEGRLSIPDAVEAVKRYAH